MRLFASVIFIQVLFFSNVRAQCYDAYYCISFDDTLCNYHISIDTTQLTENIFQIGNVHKSFADSGECSTVVIVTDTVNAYPVNNHSAFTITNLATSGDVFGFKMFSGTYYVESDSLNDYGKMELSLDRGSTWYDLLDSAYSNFFLWWTGKPVLTGHSGNCKNFEVDLANLISLHNFNIGDTILYRISFFSDSIPDSLGGIIFDNLCFAEFVEGVSEIHFRPVHSVIYPNPSDRIFRIDFENPIAESFDLAVYDICSKRIMTRTGIRTQTIELDCSAFSPGMYVYKITNSDLNKRTWGRFQVTQ